MAINETFAEYLELYHKGEANSVTSREINVSCGKGNSICRFKGNDYYAAIVEKLEHSIRQLHSRIKRIAFAERGLSSALPDYADTGQLFLPLDGGDAS